MHVVREFQHVCTALAGWTLDTGFPPLPALSETMSRKPAETQVRKLTLAIHQASMVLFRAGAVGTTIALAAVMLHIGADVLSRWQRRFSTRPLTGSPADRTLPCAAAPCGAARKPIHPGDCPT